VQRRLAAILSADVQGYSRMMSENEVATVQTLTASRRLIADVVVSRRGRVVDMPGDNVLAEFGSAVDAVQAAIAIQGDLDSRNTRLPEARRMAFRIGVNLGDVITEGPRIYGDGVNTAARIEADLFLDLTQRTLDRGLAGAHAPHHRVPGAAHGIARAPQLKKLDAAGAAIRACSSTWGADCSARGSFRSSRTGTSRSG